MAANDENDPFIDNPFAETSPLADDSPELPDRRPLKGKTRPTGSAAGNDMLWNGLTILVLLAMLSMIMAVVTILTNPDSRLNPFRPVPPKLVSMVKIPTMTASPVPSKTPTRDPSAAVVGPTGTPTRVTPAVTLTPSPEPTETFTPGPSPTPTIHSLYPYILRGEVKTIAAATFPDHESCKLWVAGQVFDLQGAPMTGATVMLGGYLNRKNLYQLSLTGTATQYGPGGYEFTIADQVLESKQAVWVELFDQSMFPLSGRIYFDTVEDCNQNLILVNFRQVR
jgi:hypothetical protein